MNKLQLFRRILKKADGAAGYYQFFQNRRNGVRVIRWKKLSDVEREKYKKRAHLININEKIKAFKKFESKSEE